MSCTRPPTESRMCGAPAAARDSALPAPVVTPRHQASPGSQARLHVTRRVADHSELAHRAAAEPDQCRQRHVGPGPAPAGIGWGQRQVDQRPPAERVEQRIPGHWREPGRQAHLDTSRAQCRDGLDSARQRRDQASAHRLGVALLEDAVALLGALLAAQQPAEHLDLRTGPWCPARTGWPRRIRAHLARARTPQQRHRTPPSHCRRPLPSCPPYPGRRP